MWIHAWSDKFGSNGGAGVRDRRKPLLVWHCYFKYFISELMIWHNPNHLIQIEELR